MTASRTSPTSWISASKIGKSISRLKPASETFPSTGLARRIATWRLSAKGGGEAASGSRQFYLVNIRGIAGTGITAYAANRMLTHRFGYCSSSPAWLPAGRVRPGSAGQKHLDGLLSRLKRGAGHEPFMVRLVFPGSTQRIS